MTAHRLRSLPYSFDPRPREGGGPRRSQIQRVSWGFDPRPREGGGTRVKALGPKRTVSIHAPVKEAAQAAAYGGFSNGVSIHAPVKEAANVAGSTPVEVVFRSTPP